MVIRGSLVAFARWLARVHGMGSFEIIFYFRFDVVVVVVVVFVDLTHTHTYASKHSDASSGCTMHSPLSGGLQFSVFLMCEPRGPYRPYTDRPMEFYVLMHALLMR